MQKWNKQHDRELSARAERRVLFWDSAKRGTYIRSETYAKHLGWPKETLDEHKRIQGAA